MKLISTGAERFMTSDEVADRILEYAGVLARAGTADVIQIAVLTGSGEPAAARLLLGPASQISLAPSDAVDVRLDDAGTLAELDDRIRRHEPPAPEQHDLEHAPVEDVFVELEGPPDDPRT